MHPDNGVFRVILERWRRSSDMAPGKAPITLLDDQGPRVLGGADLLALAERYAGWLADLGVQAGDRVGLALPTCEEFLGTFFGAWTLGAAGVPLAPLSPRQDAAHEAARLARPLSAVGAKVAVVTPQAVPVLADRGIPVVAPGDPAGGAVPGGSLLAPRGIASSHDPDLAVVQFSSGSTGHPKGVCLSHGNLLANIQAIGEVLRPTAADVGVAWLPLHHDMGLIGCLLWSQFYGIPAVLMPPEFFIRMPARWLAAMSQYRATVTSAPNFAYQLCAALPESHVQGLDLSAMQAALVGAEPVRPKALQAFAARFAARGFDPAAFVPTYGLAEATLAVTMTPPGRGMRTDRIDARQYEAKHLAVPAAPGSPDEASGREIVAVGLPLPGLTVSIRHEETGEPLGEREVGEICVEGPSVMAGYHSDPGSSATALGSGRLRTGDLGYMAGGELYVAGRLKDLIIRGGYKYHPQDLEAVAEEHEAVRIGGTSAFLVPRGEDREERLVLVAEIARAPGGSGAIGQEIRRRILEAAGIRVDEVVLVVPQQLPRTTSGKIRRAEARKRFLAGQLRPLDA